MEGDEMIDEPHQCENERKERKKGGSTKGYVKLYDSRVVQLPDIQGTSVADLGGC